MDHFEELLQSYHNKVIYSMDKENRSIEKQKAEKTASLADFIVMLDNIIAKKMKKNKVQLIPDEGKKIASDPSKIIKHPYITYKLISKTPKTEKKPRIREEIVEHGHDNTESRRGCVYGQRFNVILQFDIYASNWRDAESVLNDFEDLMLTYTYYFKQNGVAEVLYHKQYTDENLDIFRETMSIRSIQYYTEIEKLTPVFYDEYETIDVK